MKSCAFFRARLADGPQSNPAPQFDTPPALRSSLCWIFGIPWKSTHGGSMVYRHARLGISTPYHSPRRVLRGPAWASESHSRRVVLGQRGACSSACP